MRSTRHAHHIVLNFITLITSRGAHMKFQHYLISCILLLILILKVQIVPAHAVSFVLNTLKPTGYVMHQQFNIQQLYDLTTPYLCVLYLSENKQRLVTLTA
jgi:hypothetical protein